MNRDAGRRDAMLASALDQYAKLDAFLVQHVPHRTFLFDDFGWAEAVFTPLFMRFWFLDNYEDFELPDEARYARVRRWRDACLAHPAAKQVTREQIVKLYYDYTQGAGTAHCCRDARNRRSSSSPIGAAGPGRRRKYALAATDAQLGL